jgi:hypothetical protein
MTHPIWLDSFDVNLLSVGDVKKDKVMNPYIKKLARHLLTPFSLAAAKFVAVATRYAVAEQSVRAIFDRHGFHLLRKHYYLPIPDESDLTDDFWDNPSELTGLEMNQKAALDLLETVFSVYMNEFRARFPLNKTGDPRQFFLINGNYMAVDAHVYYSFIRHFKPKRIIEIGAGNSTLLAAAAGLQNFHETGRSPHLTLIEPFPNPVLKAGVPGVSELIASKVQDVSLDLFTSLEDRDILFIDSSHALRMGGDVQYEFLEILPCLAPGTLVHIHDISLPCPYPRVYFENQLYWNEQYLLQAFLAFNSRFQVLWPGNYMMVNYPEKIYDVFHEFRVMRQFFPLSEPSAFWMRVQS